MNTKTHKKDFEKLVREGIREIPEKFLCYN